MATTIMLDAGHGGYDNGATYMERREKDDNLALTMALGEILKNAGYNVLYTRESDVYQTPLRKAQIANESGADFFISLHRNAASYPNQYNGVQTLIFNPGGVKQEMAENINDELEELGFRNIEVSIRPDLAVLRRTRMPALLVEAGFIDSDKDNAIFSNQLQQVAQAIADGIEETIGATQTVTDSVVPNHSQPENEQNQGNYGVLIMGFTSMEEAQQLIRDMEMSGHETMIVQ
ncbi:MAG: N-acetylmuramoyl-L-alanine amidase [Lachnospiraceae bacterium]|nr:N-acetylmuramoyl-L-alanine amidase [Lachnospiraceae bacterium]